MADLGMTYNVSDLPDNDFAPLPAGVYTGMVTASEMKDTKNMDGKYLKLTIAIQDGEYKGRNMFVNLNLLNKDATAVKIAQAELKGLCNALGLGSVSNSTQLHNKRFNMKVKVTPAKGDYGPGNKVDEYMPYLVQAMAATGTDTPW